MSPCRMLSEIDDICTHHYLFFVGAAERKGSGYNHEAQQSVLAHLDKLFEAVREVGGYSLDADDQRAHIDRARTAIFVRRGALGTAASMAGFYNDLADRARIIRLHWVEA